MAHDARFQPQELFAEHGPVQTFMGLDPLTGLPVLIYRFPGKPDPSLDELTSENIPGILARSSSSKSGQVVVAYSKEYTPLSAPVERFDMLLLDSARALYDAAQAGVVHGDIRPERFWRAGVHHLVEGFGVRWQPDPSPYSPPEMIRGQATGYAGDVYAWAASLLKLAGEEPEEPVYSLLQQCLSPDPNARPSAKEIYQRLSEHADETADEAPNGPRAPASPAPTWSIPKAPPTPPPKHPFAEPDHNEDSAAAFDRFDVDLDISFDPPDPPATSAKTNPSQTPGYQMPPSPAALMRDARRASSDPDKTKGNARNALSPANRYGSGGYTPPRAPSSVPQPDLGSAADDRSIPQIKQSYPGVIRHPPPGARYRAGGDTPVNPTPLPGEPLEPPLDAEPERVPSRRNLWRLLGLILIALALASLALLRRSSGEGAGLGSGNRPSYILTVQIVPDDLRLVTLSVVESPSGSARRAGDEIATVPGRAVLDQEGTWQLQARFQDRTSEVISVHVPQTRTVAFEIPDDTSD